MKRKASKQRTRRLELSPKEWAAVLFELWEARAELAGCKCVSCRRAKTVKRVRNSMAAADRARARKAGK
jgi:hypothetical protein